MLFEAPDLIAGIPDIAAIYTMNDSQGEEMDKAVDMLNGNIMLGTMGKEKTARWERMLGITPFDTDNLEERRFRVQSRVLERLPYSYRVILRKLTTLCPGGFTWEVDADNQNLVVRVALASKNMREDVTELLENVVPLNMVITVIILYNTYETIRKLTYAELAGFTHQQIRDDTVIGGG